MKLFIYGNSADCIRLLDKQIQFNGAEYGVECYTKIFEPRQWTYHLFDDNDYQELDSSDAMLIFGTWGSKHPARQWTLDNPERNKQGLKDLLNQFAEKMSKGFSKPLIVTETGTFSRLRSNYFTPTSSISKKGNPRYYRMGLNHWVYGKGKWLASKFHDVERPKHFKSHFQKTYNVEIIPRENHWANNTRDGKIFVLPGLENDPTSCNPPLEWTTKVLREIQKHSDRPIVIKPHPLTTIDFSLNFKDFKNVSVLNESLLKDLYQQMYCAVIDNSTSVFELADAGIPVFCSNDSFGTKLGNTDLSNIENIYYASDDEYSNWEIEMSHTEFSVNEWNSPVIYTHIRNLLEK